mgnify:CR=1 FL=1
MSATGLLAPIQRTVRQATATISIPARVAPATRRNVAPPSATASTNFRAISGVGTSMPMAFLRSSEGLASTPPATATKFSLRLGCLRRDFPAGTPVPRKGEPSLERTSWYHPHHNVGHLRYLEGAAHEGTRLIVAVNDDESVRALKGEKVPSVDRRRNARGVRGRTTRSKR